MPEVSILISLVNINVNSMKLNAALGYMNYP